MSTLINRIIKLYHLAQFFLRYVEVDGEDFVLQTSHSRLALKPDGIFLNGTQIYLNCEHTYAQTRTLPSLESERNAEEDEAQVRPEALVASYGRCRLPHTGLE